MQLWFMSLSLISVVFMDDNQRWASPSPDLDLSPTYAENFRTWT
jgi:hypothetical protein